MDDNFQKPGLPADRPGQMPPANLPMAAADKQEPLKPPTFPASPPPPTSGLSRPTPPPVPPPRSPLATGVPAQGLGTRFTPPSPAGAGFGGQSPLARESGLRPMPPPFPVTPPRPPLPPTPPPPEITLRTMKSDLEQLKAGATPKPVLPPKPPIAAGVPVQKDLGTAPPLGLKAELSKPSLPAPKKGISKLIIIGGVVIFGIAIALLGYFVIFPMLFPAETLPTTTLPTTPTPPPTSGLPTLPELPAAKPHQSLLKTPADLQAPLLVSSSAGLPQALLSEANNLPTNTGVIKEVLLSDAAGQISFSSALPVFLPEFSSSQLANFFEDDFTAVIYYDANGAWPILIGQLKAGADLNLAKTTMAQLENSSGLASLFLSSPGTPSAAGFKNGQAASLSTRYLTFSKPGAALNYGWLGNKLIISASYNGLKKILTNL